MTQKRIQEEIIKEIYDRRLCRLVRVILEDKLNKDWNWNDSCHETANMWLPQGVRYLGQTHKLIGQRPKTRLADAITLTHDRVSIQSNHQHFLFQNSECDGDPRQTVITRGYDGKLYWPSVAGESSTRSCFALILRTWIAYQHFVLWFKHNKKTGNGNNKSVGFRMNCKRSRNKGRSYVSRLRPCNRTCFYWDIIIWCTTSVAMNGRH